MAKISTYPSADNPLLLSDRLIGTEAIRPVPSPTPLATKNFSLADLLQLFSANFPAASLQAVLNTGNTATQNITLTGTITTTLIKPINIEDTSGSQGLTFQVLSKGTSSINWVSIPVDTLQAVLNAGNTATQNITLIGDITSTKIIPGNIQDELGFIGTLGQFLSKTASGIRWVNTPAYATPTLGDVVSVGNTANQDIFINTLRIGKGTGTGSNNTALGFLTLGANTTGFGNVGVGAFTLVGNTIAARNTAVGYASLYTNISGNNNTSVGMFSQFLSQTGIGNVSLGYGTLQNNIIGSFNTSLGYRALEKNTADKNTAIGAETMFVNQTGTFNTVLGQEALRASVAGSFNSIVGCFAILNAEASYVAALGRDAGRFSSAANLLTASESIFIGFNSKSLNTSSTNEIVIGANAVGEGDNTTTIGHTTITSTRLRGAVKGGSFVKDGGTNLQYLMADGSITTGFSSPLTTKGDLYTFSMVDARLPVGTNGQILSANSAEATGLKWINVPATDVTNVSAVMVNPSQTVVVTNPTTTPQITIDDTNFTYNKFMVNQYAYILPKDVSVTFDTLRVGGTLLTTGTVSALAENPMGVQFTTATAVSSVAGFFGTNFGSTAFFGVNFTIDFSYRFRINTTNAAQRFFAGLSNMYSSATPTNIEPTAMINSVGVAKLQGSANLFFIYNDATGTASSLDLGSGFLGTDNACTYRIRIWKTSGVAALNIQLTKVVNSTGVTTTTSVLTIISDYNTGVNHHAAIWMGNNTAATGAVSFKNYGCELSKRNVINA